MDQWATTAGPVVNHWAVEANRALVPARAWRAEHGPQVAEVMLALRRFASEAHVENWADLDEDEWLAALDLMRADDGVPIAWRPSAPIVFGMRRSPRPHASRTPGPGTRETGFALAVGFLLAAVVVSSVLVPSLAALALRRGVGARAPGAPDGQPRA